MAFNYIRAGQIITAGDLNNMGLVGQVVFSATRDTAQSFANDASANALIGNALSWETVEIDDLGGWSSGSPTRYTIQRSGWYELKGAVSFVTNTTGSRTAAWFVNSAINQGSHSQRIPAATTTTSILVNSRQILLSVGDFVELCAGQSSGSALSSPTGGPRPTINISFTRPAG